MIRRKPREEKKGILLTLLIIVMVVIMLGELMSYVVINTNYQSLASSSASTLGLGSVKITAQESIHAFLKSSLGNALYALIAYEGNPATRNNILDTQQAFISLIQTNSIYGTNMLSYMGTTLPGFLSALTTQIKYQNANIAITNYTLTVFQGSPFSINASFTGLATISSQAGTFYTPLNITAGINISYTQDIAALEVASNAIIKAGSIPKALLIGNIFAQSGSISPFMFAYGNAAVITGNAVTCNTILSAYPNAANYILVTANAMNVNSMVCGMLGLVTNTINTTLPAKPYLLYSNSLVINLIAANQPILLNGPGLALLNITPLRNAISNNTYFAASYAPSYFDRISNSIWDNSPNGVVSFSTGSSGDSLSLNRLGTSQAYVANFNGIGSSVSLPIALGPGNTISVEAWINLNRIPNNNAGIISAVSLVNYGTISVFLNSNCNLQVGVTSTSWQSSTTVLCLIPNRWYHIVAWANQQTNRYGMYVNGASLINTTFNGTLEAATSFNVGLNSYQSAYFPGKIVNVQLYNTALSATAVQILYQQGLSSGPISTAGLLGWWPLGGDASDYSGNGNTGTPVGMTYTGLPADPVANLVEGALNCANINQCSDRSLQHLYLYSQPLEYAGMGFMNETTSLGLMNAGIPDALSFNGVPYLWSPVGTYYGTNGAMTATAWVYLTANTNGPIFGFTSSIPPGGWSMPLLSANGLTVYGWNGVISNTVPAGNAWYQLTVTYAPSSEVLYVNGAQAGTGNTAYSPAGGSYYLTTNVPGSRPSGVNQLFSGIMADLQLYNVSLSSTQAKQLYLNNSVQNVRASDIWPLSSGFGGAMNQSVNLVNVTNLGYISCSNANIINALCGAAYTQP